jgi:hypothetical protein
VPTMTFPAGARPVIATAAAASESRWRRQWQGPRLTPLKALDPAARSGAEAGRPSRVSARAVSGGTLVPSGAALMVIILTHLP